MTAPIGNDDSCDNMVTEGYLIFYAGITGATGVLFGAIIFYLAIVAGACGAGGISSRFQKPLVKYGYLKEFVGSSADDVANPLPIVAATDEDRA